MKLWLARALAAAVGTALGAAGGLIVVRLHYDPLLLYTFYVVVAALVGWNRVPGYLAMCVSILPAHAVVFFQNTTTTSTIGVGIGLFGIGALLLGATSHGFFVVGTVWRSWVNELS
jgi:hypothetical protein